MAGLGKLLKQAQKMQEEMQRVQEELAQREVEGTAGGGAIGPEGSVGHRRFQFFNLRLFRSYIKGARQDGGLQLPIRSIVENNPCYILLKSSITLVSGLAAQR